MSVSRGQNGDILLSGVVELAESEALLRLLIDNPEAVIDWRGCESCHTAALQVLLAAGRPMIGPPAGEFLRRWVNLG